jgi:4-diphosphocytidyl-2-C-methyl-D-erythritol kinase
LSRSTNHQNLPRVVRSPAKVNLFLEVLGRRADGFHELATIMVRTDLCDTLWIEDRTDENIELSLAKSPQSGDRIPQSQASAAADFPLDETNLITRAARALQKHTGVMRGASIRVRKMIPARAGLGGGSSNAATTLLTLNELWGLSLSLPTLHEIAATLGSDVNFLLSGYRAALCSGRGEQISPVSVNGQYHGLLLVPPTGNSTSEIFNALQLPDEQQSAASLTEQLQLGREVEIPDHCFNRLQSAAQQLNPDVHDALSWLGEHAGGGLLTGSGSACFSILKTAEEALRLANRYSSPKNGLATAFQF